MDKEGNLMLMDGMNIRQKVRDLDKVEKVDLLKFLVEELKEELGRNRTISLLVGVANAVLQTESKTIEKEE